MLKIFNTLSGQVEEFLPLKNNSVGFYSCGPTVYNYAHIGNFRAYVFFDLFKRYLRFRGFSVTHVMNITDVDDKTIRDSIKNKKSLKEFTEFYLSAFLADLKALNISLPDVMPKATDHIADIVAFIKKLMDSGFAYQSGDSVYFNIQKSAGYGTLAKLERQNLKENAEARLDSSDEYEKENANDFVLWKGYKPEDGDVFWDTELGKGRPGWHIECSVMAMKYLGDSFDVHSGGVDLVFPHHTNEIAQAEAYSGKPFVKYWLHNEHLMVDGAKMSKSLGNFYSVNDLREKGFNPILLKILLQKINYRQILNFTFAGLEEASVIAKKILELLIGLDFVQSEKENDFNVEKFIIANKEKIISAMDDDLNVSVAYAELLDFVSESNKLLKKMNTDQSLVIKKYIFELDQIFGFIENIYANYNEKLKKVLADEEVESLIASRQEFKTAKDYENADKQRAALLEKGVVINDLPGGSYSVRLLDL